MRAFFFFFLFLISGTNCSNASSYSIKIAPPPTKHAPVAQSVARKTSRELILRLWVRPPPGAFFLSFFSLHRIYNYARHKAFFFMFGVT
ncbi:hypothetical protein ASPBRDRAFT_46232 [Aspergillus brasiliensis CBS 101740]|uniref:Secreted protein n=1 Tax=Aspergillus brasiliensis (strain CBS 101740 / IMI 381727 / IBT 21946) TaxID=767769 RepID=A0A1L9UBG4_ASPBC|nr:hypothetical protein ASPBRDRAFT_46232 [Aspergillus brasiliensis CBS 101740]